MKPHLAEQMPMSLSISDDATRVQSVLEIDITFGIAEGGRAWREEEVKDVEGGGKWREGGREGGREEVLMG
jgi:hypothetical protein